MRHRVTLCLISALIWSACGGDDPAPRTTPGARSPEPPKPVFCPLTGVETSRDFPVNRPPLGIKVENSTASRPQAGLEKADIVYEELAEGGITRFLAIFHCADAENVGPIRSARMVDPDIMLEYAPALFGYSGGHASVKDKVRTTKGLADLRFGSHGDAYRRESGRPAPHNLFSSTKTLRDLKDARGFEGIPKTGLVFDPKAGASSPSPTPTGRRSPTPAASVTATASPGASVSFNYGGAASTVKWLYEAGIQAYARFHGETPHKAASGEQLKAANVVVLKVKITQGTIRDAAGNYSPEISVIGGGEAIVLRDGASITGKWTRNSLSDKTKLVDAAGKPIGLLPGATWIHLVPQDRPVTLK